MYKVKQLYIVFDDDSGHKYLIPKDELNQIENNLILFHERFILNV